MAGGERIERIRAYYEQILPFYRRESVAGAHLEFWRGLVRRWRPQRVLEVGAGLGPITAALGRRASTVGIDISLEMLWNGARDLPPESHARFVAADMRRVAFRRSFDLIVAPSDPFCHLLSQADRRRALRAAADQLSDQGHFVLDGLYRRRRNLETLRRRIHHDAGVLSIDETWVPIGGQQLWRACYHYTDRRPGEPDRVGEAAFPARSWDPKTLRGFFRSCGLRVEELWGDFDRRPLRMGAKRIIVVSRRMLPKHPQGARRKPRPSA